LDIKTQQTMRAEIYKGELRFRRKIARQMYTGKYKLSDEDMPFVRRYTTLFPRLSERLKRYAFRQKKHGLKRMLYYAEVWYYSENFGKNIKGIENRSKGMCIDHIVPINIGFENNISHKLIGSAENLQMLTVKDNFRKACLITPAAELLLIKWGFKL